MESFLIVTCALFGLCVGSFLNVLIARVPERIPFVNDRSKCPKCEHVLGAAELIPVVSWMALRAKCSHCAAPISARYPAVELLTAALFAAVAAKFGFEPELPAFLVFTAGLIVMSVIDLDTFLIHKRMLYPTLFACAALLLVAAAVEGEVAPIRTAAIGLGIGLGFIGFLWFVFPAGMGFGDVRLAALIGMMLGWQAVLNVAVGLMMAFVIASVIGIGLMALRRKGRKDAIPFGPFLAIGAMVAVLFGEAILRWWLPGLVI